MEIHGKIKEISKISEIPFVVVDYFGSLTTAETLIFYLNPDAAERINKYPKIEVGSNVSIIFNFRGIVDVVDSKPVYWTKLEATRIGLISKEQKISVPEPLIDGQFPF